MATVGIIANPESGKDIRRLVACGSVSTNTEKVNILTRVFQGLEPAKPAEVVIMPDIYGIGRQAREEFYRATDTRMNIWFLDMRLRHNQDDSCAAAARMRDLGVGCIVTLGGDGTNRVVAKGCGRTPILPISTGTNNVFPYMVEGTVAGMAAGMVTAGVVDPSSVISQRKRIEVLHDDAVMDIALIDAVVTTDTDIGTKAIWDVDRVRQIVQTCGSLKNIGLSSIGGAVHRISSSDGKGLSLELGTGEMSVLAPIAPGLIKEVRLKSIAVLNIGDEVPVRHVPSIIALDGERQLRVRRGDHVRIRLSEDGPRVIEIFKVLEFATEVGFFQGGVKGMTDKAQCAR